MKEVLRIGFVATSISPYYAEEQNVRKNSEEHLKLILKNYDVELLSFHKTIFSKEDSEEAERFFNKKIDFLLLQTSSCSSGEQLYPLCNIVNKMGIWAVPDQETEGDVKLHSLVSTSHYLGIIKKLLSEKKIKTKVGPRRPGDSKMVVADPNKFNKTFNWKPKFNKLNYILNIF